MGGYCRAHQIDGKNVIRIQLRNSSVSDEDLVKLKSIKNEVEVLGLEGTKVTDRGLAHLRCFTILENISKSIGYGIDEDRM